MAKIDEVKEWLNFLNRLFTIGLVTLLGIVSWLFLHYISASKVLIIASLIGLFVCFSNYFIITFKKNYFQYKNAKGFKMIEYIVAMSFLLVIGTFAYVSINALRISI